MKAHLIFLAFSMFAVSDALAQNRVIETSTENTSLIYTVGNDRRLIFRYYGSRISNPEEFSQAGGYTKPDTKREMNYEAYPSFGFGMVNEPAFSAVNPDGSLISEFVFDDSSMSQSGNLRHTVISMKDTVYNLNVELHTEAYIAEDVMKQWVVVRNMSGGPVTLKNFFSSYLNFHANKYYLTHFYGSWAGEMNRIEEKLTPGIKSVESKKGIRTTHSENPSFILSLDRPVSETSGKCVGGALAWSGNYRLVFEIDERNVLNILCGMNPFMADYRLENGENLESPQMIYTFSNNGQGTVSRNFHDWARTYGMHNGYKEHPVILNSWEGAYFKFDEKVLLDMMDDAADIGVELFVLDDGWFGNKYPRNSDKMGLGDWQVNRSKLPHGLQYLIDYAHSKGLGFGIWVEPEMVNPQSELAAKHPEWIVQSPGREQITMRNQLLLDLTNPEVREFIFNTIDNLLTENNGIDYIKWDANRHVEQVGSTYLPSGKQMHFWMEYTKGLYSIYEKIREKYPELILQVCSSGGGRIDFGSLKYHDEFWTSDNTDALQRIYMQYSTNLIYPPVATGAHVSAVPGHQTGLVTPLKFRFDVAMSGRLGLELQPKDMSEDERAFAANAIRCYKEHVRDLVTKGDLYRLVSPYECSDKYAANMYVGKDKDKAVMFAYCTGFNRRGILPVVVFDGLDAEKTYRITEINRNGGKPAFWGDGMTFSGEYLMNAGIELRIARQFESAVFLLEAL